MSAEVINLRQARKQRERDARRRQADENRAQHGRKKMEREQAESEAKAQAELLDGHWLDQSDEKPAPELSDDETARKDRDEP